MQPLEPICAGDPNHTSVKFDDRLARKQVPLFNERVGEVRFHRHD
jgi:hypothetical protein